MYRKLFMTLVVSWIFMRSTYSDKPPVRPYVEPLYDVPTHGYNIKRTNIRGTDGSWDTYREIQRW